MAKLKSPIFIVAVISVFTYVLFFHSIFNSRNFFWGSDATIKHYPARVYLYNTIFKEHRFPFWTEKMFSGFPVYADMENAYLNPINVLSVILFGPGLSYRILHITSYLLGSLSLYVLLKRRGFGLITFFITNLIYYFSFFNINHLIHFNIIMAIYLFPLCLLLADLFIEKPKFRYVVLQSFVISYAVLWGQLQIVLIMLMGIALYLLFMGFKKLKFKMYLIYFILTGILVFIQTLPQLYPSYLLFVDSRRNGEISYTQGSLTPPMALVTIYPFLFEKWQGYRGVNISPDYSYTEIYIYLGITTVVLAFCNLLFMKKARFHLFAYALIWIFLLFGFIKYIPLISANTPIISLFRYWERTIFLAAIGVGFLAGDFIQNLKDASLKNLKKNLLFVLAPFVYLLVLDIFNSKDTLVVATLREVHLTTIFSYPMFRLWLGLLSLTIVLVSLTFIFKRGIKYLKAILCLLVLADLLILSRDVISTRIQPANITKLENVSAEFDKKRIVLKSGAINGFQSAYYNFWSPFGYSQLGSVEYSDLFYSLGFGNLRLPVIYTKVANYPDFAKLGIYAVVNKSDSRVYNILPANKPLDLIQNNIEGEYLIKEEGKIKIDMKVPFDQTVFSYIKYDRGWNLLIDGRQSTYTKSTTPFLNFQIRKGEHIVEFTYIPKPFIAGLKVSGSLALLFVGFFLLRKRLL